MTQEKYGRVKFTTIQKTKNDLRDALNQGDLIRAQELWDRLEQWIDSPPMQMKKGKSNESLVSVLQRMGRSLWLHGRWLKWEIKRRWLKGCVEEASRMTRSHFNIAKNDYEDHLKKEPK